MTNTVVFRGIPAFVKMKAMRTVMTARAMNPRTTWIKEKPLCDLFSISFANFFIENMAVETRNSNPGGQQSSFF